MRRKEASTGRPNASAMASRLINLRVPTAEGHDDHGGDDDAHRAPRSTDEHVPRDQVGPLRGQGGLQDRGATAHGLAGGLRLQRVDLQHQLGLLRQ